MCRCATGMPIDVAIVRILSPEGSATNNLRAYWYHRDDPHMPDKHQPLHASTSEAVTNNVRVEVESQYAPEHSMPFQHQWFFYYTIRITNETSDTVQLLSR